MKKSLREKIKNLPTIDEMIQADLKNPEFADEYRRARLKIAVVRAIKTAREKAKMSQTELARAVGVKQSMIGRLESMKGISLPNLDLLTRIARATHKKLVIEDKSIHLELAAK